MTPRKVESDLQSVLRKTDPVRELSPPTSAEVAEMRRAVLAEVREPGGFRFWTAVLAGAAALLALGVGLSLLSPLPDRTETGISRAARRHLETREIRFVTPGGTHVVWTLDPDFDL